MSDQTPPQDNPLAGLAPAAARLGIAATMQGFINDVVAEARTDVAAELRKLGGIAKMKTPSTEIEIPGLGAVGNISLPKTNDTVTVTDQAAYAAWVEENYPGEVVYEVRVRDNFLKAHLKALVAGADFESGEVVDAALSKKADGVAVPVDGVKAVKGGEYKSPSVTGLKKDDILSAIKDRSLLALTAQPEPAPQADQPVVIEHDPATAVDVPDVKSMKRPELVKLCEDLGLERVGTLPTLRKRVLEHYGVAA